MDYFRSVYVSAATGKRVDTILGECRRVLANSRRRIATGLLNDVLTEADRSRAYGRTAFEEGQQTQDLLHHRSLRLSAHIRSQSQRSRAHAFQLSALSRECSQAGVRL